MAAQASLLMVLCVCCAAVAFEGASVCTNSQELSFLSNERLFNLHQRSAILSATHKYTGTRYNYYLGVCTNPNPTLMPDPDCMVIQTEYFEGNRSTGAIRCLGRKNSAQLTDTLDLGWIELTYSGGDAYHTDCGQAGRVSRIFFFCDHSAGEGTPMFIEEDSSNDYCYYLFNWPTSYICPVASTNLWFIVAILMFLCTVAMAIGILVYCRVRKRVAQGKTPFNISCKTCSARQTGDKGDQSVKQPLADAEDLVSEEGLIPVV